MSATIESTHSCILSKIGYIRELCNLLKFSQQKINIVENKYMTGVADIIVQYYDNINADIEEQLTESYYLYLGSSNINNELGNLIREILSFIQKNSKYTETIYRILSKYNTMSIDELVIHNECNKCKQCGSKLFTHPQLYETKCTNCGLVNIILGSMIDEDEDDVKKYKHGNFIPSRHSKFWVARIQGKEKFKIDEDDKIKIIYCIRRDGKNPAEISYEDYRRYFKENRMSKYNDHTPLFKKEVSGISPPQLTKDEETRLLIKFNKADAAFSEIKPSTRNKKPYYPFFFYKCIEDEFKNNPDKLKLLECIHLQSENTIFRNDNIWYDICNYNGWDKEKKPTIRPIYE